MVENEVFVECASHLRKFLVVICPQKSYVSSLDMLISYVSFSGRWVDVGGSLEEKTSKGGAKMKMDNESTICVELFLKISAFF